MKISRKELRIVIPKEKEKNVASIIEKAKLKHKYVTDAQAVLAIVELYDDLLNDTQRTK